jgi:hypothetical protein
VLTDHVTVATQEQGDRGAAGELVDWPRDRKHRDREQPLDRARNTRVGQQASEQPRAIA